MGKPKLRKSEPWPRFVLPISSADRSFPQSSQPMSLSKAMKLKRRRKAKLQKQVDGMHRRSQHHSMFEFGQNSDESSDEEPSFIMKEDRAQDAPSSSLFRRTPMNFRRRREVKDGEQARGLQSAKRAGNLSLNEYQVSARLNWSGFDEEFKSSFENCSDEGSVGNETEEFNNVKVYEAEKTRTLFVVLNHPTSFAVSGTALVKVFCGTVEILGYRLTSDSSTFVPVYSSKHTLSLKVETAPSDSRDLASWDDIKRNLNEFASERVTNCILGTCTESSVVIGIKRNTIASSAAVQFACSYVPAALSVERSQESKFSDLGLSIHSCNEYSLQFSRQYYMVSEMLMSVVKNHKLLKREMAPCFFIYGSKGLGKSTAARFFINRMLGKLQSVLLLDCDPGQTEFTPPGCVSLTEVTDPLLGPPFTHMKTPEIMSFYGSDDIVDALGDYQRSVKKVVEFYKENLSHIPLFVNTYGWIKGLGKNGLDFIRSLVNPSVEIEIVPTPSAVRALDMNELMNSFTAQDDDETRELKIASCCPQLNFLDAPNRRNLSILAYFGRLQSRFEHLKLINSFKPYSVKIKDIAITLAHYSVNPDLWIDALFGQLVALYEVDDSEILVPLPGDDEDEANLLKPKRLTNYIDYGNCLGFALVRAYDLKKGVLYLVTPEPVEKLAKVNALIRGCVQTPDVVFLKQMSELKISTSGPLPYVMKMENAAPHLKTIKPFHHRISGLRKKNQLLTI